MSRLAFPFGPTPLGRSAAVAYGSDLHVRQMLELLVFTLPGERVMRPELGSPISEMVFGPLGGPTSIALQAALQAAIQQWLGDLIDLLDLTVRAEDTNAVLEITVTYEIRSNRTVSEVQLRKDLT